MTSQAATTIGASDLAAHETWLDNVLAAPNPVAEPRCDQPREMREAAEQLEPWLVEELQRGAYHLDGFTWRYDPPTDEGFKIPLSGDTDRA